MNNKTKLSKHFQSYTDKVTNDIMIQTTNMEISCEPYRLKTFFKVVSLNFQKPT